MTDKFKEKGAKVRDRVRVELVVNSNEPLAVEGPLYHRSNGVYGYYVVAGWSFTPDDDRITNVIVLESAPTPEPSIGSVIEDSRGIIRQRLSDGLWYSPVGSRVLDWGIFNFTSADDFKILREGWGGR